MKYTEVIYLLKKNLISDDIGNNYYDNSSNKKKVYAFMQKVGTNEFYNALAVGLKPSYEFRIRLSNYNNETQVEYNNQVYDVIRTIPDKRNNEIVLVLGLKIGINDD